MNFFNYFILASVFIIKILSQEQCFSVEEIKSSNSLFIYNESVYDLADYNNHPGGDSSLNGLPGNMLSDFVNNNTYSFHLDSDTFYSDLVKIFKGKICVDTTPLPTTFPTTSSEINDTTLQTSTTSTSITSKEIYKTTLQTFTSTPTTKSLSCLPFVFPNYVIDYNPTNTLLKSENIIGLILNENGGTRISISNVRQSKIDVSMKVSSGMNIVSSIYLVGYSGDQVNFNVVQNSENTTIIETNYYYRNLVKYDINAIFVNKNTEFSSDFHKYTIISLEDSYEYLLDNISIRKIYKKDVDMFPDNIDLLKISIWEAPPSSWGGPGLVLNNKTIQYETLISSISIECFTNGDASFNQQDSSSSTSNVKNEIGLILSLYFTLSYIFFC